MRRTGRAGLWLRWSWRDLRARWVLVAAIAAIVAVGVGVYAGLSSTAAWRRVSYDRSYAALRAHDVQVTLGTDSFVAPGRLTRAIEASGAPVAEIETRLVVPTQVDASRGGRTILVPGRLVGVDVAAGGPHVDGLSVEQGRALGPARSGRPRVVLDAHFANHYDLPPAGRIRLAGGIRARYVGHALSPEYFLIVSEQGTLLAEAGYAVVFAPVATVQDVAGRDGLVNDAVVRLSPGADAGRAARRIEEALATRLPGVTADVTTLEEHRVRRYLYDDIEGDQRLYNIFAFLILGGAAFAAFNLIGRIVEAQRREIGIGMALGVPRLALAARPALVGLQVALTGTVLGVGVGLLVSGVIGDFMRTFLPLPVWDTPFEPGTFARGAALGLALPFAATLWPVWRAVRVDPIAAIRTGPGAARRITLAPVLRRVARGGHSVRQLPFRNVLRAPRRTLLTVFAIAASIATLISVIGMVDSFLGTVTRGEREILGDTPRRMTVDLDRFYPVEAPQVRDILTSDLVAEGEVQLRVGGTLEPGPDEFDVLLTLLDFRSAMWAPTAAEGSLRHDAPGIVLSDKAARDLDVGVGDAVTLRHPRREGLGYRWVERELPVLALHPNPYRFVAFMDLRDASIMNLDGIVNTMQVLPARGVSRDELTRGLFGEPGVGAVQPVAAYAETFREVMDEVLDVLGVVRAAVLLLALLIAFNTSSISADERAREHATMFAFGLPIDRVVLVGVIESLLVGVLGTLVGAVLGFGLLGWIVHFLLPTTLPDVGVRVAVSGTTVATAVGLGTVAVALAPLFTRRRLARMDIPATLRVVE